ncbi:uncharacterized protein FFMR_04928 [Fusarium fujikuroi]|nr:uncharacterized protein FFMR_04928 [Fusarium fujikuroi]
MSGYPNYGMLPEDENQSQNGNQDQNPGQYHNGNNSIQRFQCDPNLINATFGPGEPSFDQSAGSATWEQQTPIPQGQQANQPNPPVQEEWNFETQSPYKVAKQTLKKIFIQPFPDPQAEARAWSWTWALTQLHNLAMAHKAMLAQGKFDHCTVLGAPEPFTFENPRSAGCNPQVPIPSQQHEPRSIAGHRNVVNARADHGIVPPGLPAPPFSQPSLAGPSTGGHKKRGRAASPDTTAPAPKRTRNLSPNASGAEGSDANSSGIPNPTPNTTSPPSRQPHITRKRKAATDRGGDDGEDDLLLDPRPQKKPRGEPAASENRSNSRSNTKKGDRERVVQGTKCLFCDKHPEISAVKPCDWEQVSQSNGPKIYNLECTNCADYRSRNKDNTELAEKGGHKCQVPGPEKSLIHFEHKRYGVDDPQTYEDKSCSRCKRKGWEATCDADTILGYSCLICRRDEECRVGEEAMPFKRPNKLTRRPWYRHPCDRCLLRHKADGKLKEADCCSWIKDREEWENNQACRQCQRDGTICLDLGAPMGSFSERAENEPTSWEIRTEFEADKEKTKGDKTKKEKWHEYTEVLPHTTWRKPCQGCQTAGKATDCLVMWFQPDHACERCTQIGIDCMVPENGGLRHCPIFDLSRVGFGQFTPYQACEQCLKAGRNCDRQRPCDSCIRHNARCDAFHWAKPGCIDRGKIAKKKNKKTYNPGPLYYLALGYGPEGVNDLKDGRSIEHWIGPTAPVYGLIDPKDGPQLYKSVANAHQSCRPPVGIRPPAPLQSGMELKERPAEFWRELMNKCWLNSQPQPPKNYPQAYQEVWSLLRSLQDFQMAQVRMEPNLPVPFVRSFRGGPVLADIERTQSHIPSAAYQNPDAAQSQGVPQLPPNQPSMQYGDTYNPQQNAPEPQAPPYPFPAGYQPGGYTDLLSQTHGDPAAAGQEEDGGISQQQLPPVQPFPGPEQIHDSFDQQTFSQAQNGQQMQQDQGLLNLQGYGNSDQQQSDPYSQQMGPHQGPVDPEEDRQRRENLEWEKILGLLSSTAPQNADDESGERRPLAKSAIPAPVIENDQQERHSGSQSPEESNESLEVFKRRYGHFVDRSGEQAHGRSRANRGERWHKPQTSRGNKGSSQERTARGRRAPKNANDQVAFNPFLGFTFGPNQKPQSKEKPKSSRWKIFNHLEGIDMSEWHESKSKDPEEESRPRLFSIANGQTNQPTPLRDVLGDVPCEEKVTRTTLYCGEPGEGGWGLCNAWNTDSKGQAICQSHAHRNTALPYFPVCNDCTRGNVKYLFQHEHNPITQGELLSMRAYLCNDCAGQMSSGAPNAVQNQIVGTRRVYGTAVDEAHSQSIPSQAAANPMRNTEALTGCSCANRMLGTSLCQFHRLYYAEEVMKHAALMQEWRLSRFKKAVCPSCLAQKPSEKVNISANVDGFVRGAPTAWACVVCNDWLVNEHNDVNNQPKAIDKPLWNLNIGRKLLDPRRKITTGRVLGQVVSV